MRCLKNISYISFLYPYRFVIYRYQNITPVILGL